MKLITFPFQIFYLVHFFSDCERNRINSNSNIHLYWPMVCNLFSTSLQTSNESCRHLDRHNMAGCSSLWSARVSRSLHIHKTTEIWYSIIHTMHDFVGRRRGENLLYYSGIFPLHVSFSLKLSNKWFKMCSTISTSVSDISFQISSFVDVDGLHSNC